MSGTRRVAWIALVVLSAAYALSHVVLAFTVDDVSPWVFVSFALLNLGALLVLLVPYRRLRWWAWCAVWLEVAALASTLAWTETAVWVWYVGVAAIMAAAQCVTLRGFRSQT